MNINLQYLQRVRGLREIGLKVNNTYSDWSRNYIATTLKGYARDTITNLCPTYGNECKDLGGDLANGGITFDIIAAKMYLRGLLDTYYGYLVDINGKLHYDIPHIAVVADMLRNSGRVDDSCKALAVGLLLNADKLAVDLSSVLQSRGKTIKIPLNLYSLEATKYANYSRRYMSYLTIPAGYDCYIYEPTNIAQIALLVGVFGVSPAEATTYLNEGGSGLLVRGISQLVENRYMDMLFSFKMKNLDGYFGNKYLSLYDKFASTAGGYMQGYTSYIIPTMSGLMTQSFLIPFERDLAAMIDLTERDCYINYIAINRVSFVVCRGIDINYILPSIAPKVKQINPLGFDLRNIATLEY